MGIGSYECTYMSQNYSSAICSIKSYPLTEFLFLCSEYFLNLVEDKAYFY